jgi:arylsulfatase A-like enzyme
LSEDDVQEWASNYYRLVKGVDIAVGQILAPIDNLGFGNNTFIILTSDSGHMLYEHGLLGKWLMYEESIRVTLIVFDPRFPKQLAGR